VEPSLENMVAWLGRRTSRSIVTQDSGCVVEFAREGSLDMGERW